MFLTVTRCPTILTLIPILPSISFATNLTSEFCLKQLKPAHCLPGSQAIRSHRMHLRSCLSTARAVYISLVQGQKGFCLCSGLCLFTSMWASHSNSGLLLPVNLKAPTLIRSSNCSRPGLTLLTKVAQALKFTFLFSDLVILLWQLNFPVPRYE